MRSALRARSEELIEFLRADTATARRELAKFLGPITCSWDDERNEPVWVMLDRVPGRRIGESLLGPSTAEKF